jgi:hypothetical protein
MGSIWRERARKVLGKKQVGTMKPPILVAALLAVPILEVLDDFQVQEVCRADLAMCRVMCLLRWPASGIAHLLMPFPTQRLCFEAALFSTIFR